MDVLDALPFPPGRWVVAGSAPLLIAGLIQSIEDVDVVVDSIAWHQALSLSDLAPLNGRYGDHVLELEVAGVAVEVFDGWLGIEAARMIAEAVVVDDVPLSPLIRVLESKRLLERPKDLTHIEIIEAHLTRVRERGSCGERPGSD